MKINLSYAAILTSCIIVLQLYAQPTEAKTPERQQFCNLGDFTLESGEVIYDCKVGYRVYGKPNAAMSNIILWPTWLTGTAADHEAVVPGKFIDTSAYYLIIVEPFGNGVSSSPSNSSRQPKLKFPKFSITDMVKSQYRMLTEYLKIQHLYAIGGFSMGGMQAFQWAVTYPGFADKIISIVGSPQTTSYDMLLFRSLIQAIKTDTAFHNGNYTENPQKGNQSLMWELAITTPEYVAQKISRDSFDNWFIEKQGHDAFDRNDLYRQLEAISENNISKPFNGSLQEAAKLIKAKMLIIVSKYDHIVNPNPATEIAGMLNAKLITLESNCGHIAPLCEEESVTKEINSFLATK